MDARRVASGDVIEADVCVIGGGPAGLTLASELTGDVCVLESGGAELDARQQELSDARNHGTPLSDLKAMRRRQLGGNANAWNIVLPSGETGVRYARLDAYDLARWPFGLDELAPYYERAHAICGLGPYEEPAPKLDRLSAGVFRFGRSAAFRELPNRARTYLHATALELLTEGDRVDRVKVATVPGHHFFVRANRFVLALGALENARLLLLSDRRHVGGLGNQHELVGRGFMDHPLIDAGLLTPHDRSLFERMAFFDLREVAGEPVMGRLSLREDVMRAEQLLNATAYLYPRPSPRQTAAVHAIGELKHALQPRALPRQALRIARGFDYVLYAAYLQRKHGQAVLHGFARGGWSQLARHFGRFEAFRVLLQTEQSPERENRLWLSEQRDRLGARKLELAWRWSPEDQRRIARTRDLFAEALAPLGTLQGTPRLHLPAGLAHHMGTTRMHRDPGQGVVDEHSRVHGVANLYVAGSSVFPSGGYANPTLTIVALAARLAEHLNEDARPRARV